MTVASGNLIQVDLSYRMGAIVVEEFQNIARGKEGTLYCQSTEGENSTKERKGFFKISFLWFHSDR